MQSQFFLSRTFKGVSRDPRNDFGGYTVVDGTVAYDTGKGTIYLAAQNLLDRFYIDYSSDTRLPTDNFSYFAGRGRTITLLGCEVLTMKWLDLLHRWTGGVIGLVLALLGLTGCLLVWKTAWIMVPGKSMPLIRDPASVAMAVQRMLPQPRRGASVVFRR